MGPIGVGAPVLGEHPIEDGAAFIGITDRLGYGLEVPIIRSTGKELVFFWLAT